MAQFSKRQTSPFPSSFFFFWLIEGGSPLLFSASRPRSVENEKRGKEGGQPTPPPFLLFFLLLRHREKREPSSPPPLFFSRQEGRAGWLLSPFAVYCISLISSSSFFPQLSAEKPGKKVLFLPRFASVSNFFSPVLLPH